jgi:hypothetical protein
VEKRRRRRRRRRRKRRHPFRTLWVVEAAAAG